MKKGIVIMVLVGFLFIIIGAAMESMDAPGVPEGDDRVMLVYQDDRLYQKAPGGDLAFKPIADVKHIVYITELNAWQVTWTV